jgi:hypothetical protein
MKRAIDAEFVPIRAWMLQRDGWPVRVYLMKKKAGRAKKIRKSGNGKRKWTIIKVWIAGGANSPRPSR